MENAAVLKLVDAIVSLTQIFLIICEFEKCDFILILSKNLEHFQSVVLALMWTACWLIMSGRKKRKFGPAMEPFLHTYFCVRNQTGNQL
jgi:hypothetical protein